MEAEGVEAVTADWLLFCSHPIAEEEQSGDGEQTPYLTFYSFSDVEDGALQVGQVATAATADQTHRAISALEKSLLEQKIADASRREASDRANLMATAIRDWLAEETQLGAASFLEEDKFFAPVPIALVCVV